MKRNKFIIVFMIMFFSAVLTAEDKLIPRVIISPYIPTKEVPNNQATYVHRLAEMPLNHLGLIVEYHDITKGLPDLSKREDVRGVLTWFPAGEAVPETEAYFSWCKKAIASGKKFLVIGNPAFSEGKNEILARRQNRFWKKLGIKSEDRWIANTYRCKLKNADPEVVGFERKYPHVLPAYNKFSAAGTDLHVYLWVENTTSQGKSLSPLIVSNPNGGYISERYAFNTISPAPEGEQWYINPLKYFSIVFDTSDLPKPDTTTLAGRRIYFSHVDGDGWNSMTLISRYKKKPILVSRVILDEAIKPFPDLPVTIGPVGGDLSPAWHGTMASRLVARDIFIQPQVEAGVHTMSHPYQWNYFEKNPEQRKDRKKSEKTQKKKKGKTPAYEINEGGRDLDKGYEHPRAYDDEPFSLKNEVYGGINEIKNYLPSNKKVGVFMWSGDTSPFELAIKTARQAKVRNINGGDSRFDNEFPSMGWVAPVGSQVGNQRQIYAVTSNENTYTNLWQGPYHGFTYLKQTLHNTGTPVRLKPINVYYHAYSGEREASIRALVSNLRYADKQKICPVKTSEYCAVADGFFTCKLYKTGKNSWRIEDRDGLQTIRFDQACSKSVDFSKSKGVIGQKHFQGSLYVYLDMAVKTPELTLKKNDVYWKEPVEKLFYLVGSRWQLENVKQKDESVSFRAFGFGNGEMVWNVPSDGTYSISAGEKTFTAKAENNILKLKIEIPAINGIDVSIRKNN